MNPTSTPFSLYCLNKFLVFFLQCCADAKKNYDKSQNLYVCKSSAAFLSLSAFFLSHCFRTHMHTTQSSPTRPGPTLVSFCQCTASGTLKLPRHQRMCDRADHCSACSYMVKLVVPLRLVGIGGRSGLVAVPRGPQ